MIRVTQIEAGVTSICLDRPELRNALTPQMLREFVDVVKGLTDETRCVLLCGSGEVFCAGFDLTLCREDPSGEHLRSLLTLLSASLDALRGLVVPVVVGVLGGAIAGGCALLGGADVVVSHRGAKFGYPVAKLGISPAVSAPWLAGAIGWGLAREALLVPSVFDGREAERIGLVDVLVDEAGEVHVRAMDIAKRLGMKPRSGLGTTRGWMREIGVEGGIEGETGAAALQVSLSLVGSEEQQALLPRAWGREGGGSRTKDG
ncbi:MAG: enoyl-CoA hydratase/isomerase family protein [Phycisphaeraceae bacterium]|nr:enoyl-CoA hydratase/isomerase family protein [Phycisphaeraceae bacterium]